MLKRNLIVLATMLVLSVVVIVPARAANAGADKQLINAVSLGNKGIGLIKAALLDGVDINSVDKYGRTALHCAVEQELEEVVRVLLEHNANVNKKTETWGRTPLHIAAHWGHAPIVELLLKRGAWVDVRDNGGNTPLHLAAAHGASKKVIELLLDAGADPNKKSKARWERTPLHAAAFWGHAHVVELLLERGAKVDARGKFGKTPLHLAVTYGVDKGVIELLLDNGADPNKKDKEGSTPLERSMILGKEPNCTLLKNASLKQASKASKGSACVIS